MKLTLKKNTVMQLSKDLDVVPMSLTKEIAGGGTNGCTGTVECEHTGQCLSTKPADCTPYGSRGCITTGGSTKK